MQLTGGSWHMLAVGASSRQGARMGIERLYGAQLRRHDTACQ